MNVTEHFAGALVTNACGHSTCHAQVIILSAAFYVCNALGFTVGL
jgi:hypothetical protein